MVNGCRPTSPTDGRVISNRSWMQAQAAHTFEGVFSDGVYLVEWATPHVAKEEQEQKLVEKLDVVLSKLQQPPPEAVGSQVRLTAHSCIPARNKCIQLVPFKDG